MDVCRLPREPLHQVIEIFLREHIHSYWTDLDYFPGFVDPVEALLLTSRTCNDMSTIIFRSLFGTCRLVEQSPC
jgi:hypothetical protein